MAHHKTSEVEIGVMEALLARKMSLEKNKKFTSFGRSDSADSVCSSVDGSGNGNGDRCRCDDCILGITDLFVMLPKDKTTQENSSSATPPIIRKVRISQREKLLTRLTVRVETSSDRDASTSFSHYRSLSQNRFGENVRISFRRAIISHVGRSAILPRLLYVPRAGLQLGLGHARVQMPAREILRRRRSSLPRRIGREKLR